LNIIHIKKLKKGCEFYKITNFGSTQYRKLGWATKNEISLLSTVAEAINFFVSEKEFGLIDFIAQLRGFGTLSTHDDGFEYSSHS